jgi:hypothetical protein
MLAGETAAAPGEETGDDGEVLDLVAGDGGHGHHPIFGRVGFGPAIHQFKGVGGGFFFEMGVVVEQQQRLREDILRPSRGRLISQWQVGFGHE